MTSLLLTGPGTDPTPWADRAEDVLDGLRSCHGGLSTAEAADRLEAVGPNQVAAPQRTALWRRALAHLRDVLVLILLAAAALKAVLGDWVDVAVILAVVVVNVGIGLVQEGRARRALDVIALMLAPTAVARRDGTWLDVDARDLVPGDLVRVRPGDRVPADVRLVEATTLQVEESALTGESAAAVKSVDPVRAAAGLGDRTSMLYSGTLVVAGTGVGVVVATGASTEIGRIQSMVSEVGSLQTPLARTLAVFSRRLALLIGVTTVLMVAVGWAVHDFAPAELASAAIGFAVAAIPEGLPAVVTITLALAVQRMARRRAITRRLPAVETLGAVSTICSDKTGTLTTNEMTVRAVVTRAHRFAVAGTGYLPRGAVTLDGNPVSPGSHPDLARLVEVLARCNDAHLVEHDGAWGVVGEPTEGALTVLARKTRFVDDGWRRLAEIPFDSAAKYMVTLDEDPDGLRHLLVKGALDSLISSCTTQTGPDGSPEPLDAVLWSARLEELGSQGLRVLAAARAWPRPGTTGLSARDVEDGLELVGLVGIADPPRPEAIDAIAEARGAGVRVTMITGDHAGTALAIAREMGIADDTARAVTGPELEAMDDAVLRDQVTDVPVFARTTPEHKLRIVRALQSRGEVVAMTGDGVNDAPALTQADVGVAMGIKGTEATKEAADVVLADDNFATIERAVVEGRRVYDNIRKAVLFLLPTNGAQSLVLLVAVLFGMALPLQPTQVLWINMVTSVTLSLPLARELAEADVMRRPPRRPDAPLVDAAFLRRIALVSVLIGGATLGLFAFEVAQGAPLARAQATAVTMLALGQLAYLFSCRFLDRSSLTLAALRGNPAVWWSAGALLALQAAFLYLPFMQRTFDVQPIGAREWALALALAVVVLLATEAAKALGRRRDRRRPRA
ncbi:HAD-IC family P-type ATPase [Cellulosimicrobium cellulans]|uniref:HAD-IC family P-type ATPase n=1 Tax=Cellulosimicrobium cellulans TaxID=1710 RepID=UPI003668630B